MPFQENTRRTLEDVLAFLKSESQNVKWSNTSISYRINIINAPKTKQNIVKPHVSIEAFFLSSLQSKQYYSSMIIYNLYFSSSLHVFFNLYLLFGQY
jgi:hypothetical protein